MSIDFNLLLTGELLFKFILISFFSMCIGYNRGSRNHVAGLRTHLLVAVGAMTCMLTSIAIIKAHPELTMDPFRLSAQVISGIGFLGAGTILKTGNYIRGLTTAASLWVVSIIGITVGAGQYLIAFMTFIIVYISLKFFNKFKFLSTSKYVVNSLMVTYLYCDQNRDCIEQKLEKCGVSQKKLSILDSKKIGVDIEVTIKIDIFPENSDETINDLLLELTLCDFVSHVTYIDELDKVAVQI